MLMVITQSELVIDDVYARLRDMVVSNVLHSGQKLVDRELAEQLGVSRTPVREALGRLAMTGLVENRARRGYYVSRFSAEEVPDLYEFRVMPEVDAVMLAVRTARSSDLDEFERILGELGSHVYHPRSCRGLAGGGPHHGAALWRSRGGRRHADPACQSRRGLYESAPVGAQGWRRKDRSLRQGKAAARGEQRDGGLRRGRPGPEKCQPQGHEEQDGRGGRRIGQRQEHAGARRHRPSR